jgi:hypothetical protein
MFRRLVFKMKFKEKRGNIFVFDGGYAGDELTLEKKGCTGSFFWFGSVAVTKNMAITIEDDRINVPYKDIQTAVNLMQILINEGLV